jgi:hypothetical protein
MKNTTMNLAKRLPQAKRDENTGQKVKKVELQIEVGNSNLGHEVKRMFNLAKSSGLELDLTFSNNQTQSV